MPNWCNGEVIVKGKEKDIINFCRLFIAEEQEGKKKGKMFARSFLNQSWRDFKHDLEGQDEAEFSVNFAWSVHSCIIEGYPNDKDCVTLIDACKKHKVDVVIDSTEDSMGFEEHIECSADGKLIEITNNMPLYKCKCGKMMYIPSQFDIKQEECYGCGMVGKFRRIKQKGDINA